MPNRTAIGRAAALIAVAASTALVITATGGASHLGSLQLGHVNTSNESTELTGTAGPELQVTQAGNKVAIKADSSTGKGVYGRHTGNAGADPAVQGDTSSTVDGAVGMLGKVVSATPGANSAAVRGINSGTLDKGIGVWGSQDGSGLGVFGHAPSGTGVLGTSDGGTGALGVHVSASGTSPGVKGETFSTETNAFGVFGEVLSASPDDATAGVFGRNDGTGRKGYGVWGVQAGSGKGVVGHAPSGIGVYGSTQVGTGVRGFSPNGTGIFADGAFIALDAVTNDSGGRAVYAHHDGTESGFGVYATTGGGGTGVYATATGPTGPSGGTAVFGKQLNSGNTGVLATPFRGVEGTAANSNGIGVAGTADNGASAIGVYGTSASGYAGRFIGKVRIDGDLQVLGNVTKGGGSFRIDHPLDPEHKYLQHSFVESPDMKNVYDGVVTTDRRGYATVRLPRWFQSLNRDFRYQLTPIGDLVLVAVSREIAGNSFTIRSARPHVKVSWQVTGIRHDRYANEHRIRVVERKSVAEKGDGLHP
jgi:hypothetical protein